MRLFLFARRHPAAPASLRGARRFAIRIPDCGVICRGEDSRRGALMRRRALITTARRAWHGTKGVDETRGVAHAVSLMIRRWTMMTTTSVHCLLPPPVPHSSPPTSSRLHTIPHPPTTHVPSNTVPHPYSLPCLPSSMPPCLPASPPPRLPASLPPCLRPSDFLPTSLPLFLPPSVPPSLPPTPTALLHIHSPPPHPAPRSPAATRHRRQKRARRLISVATRAHHQKRAAAVFRVWRTPAEGARDAGVRWSKATASDMRAIWERRYCAARTPARWHQRDAVTGAVRHTPPEHTRTPLGTHAHRWARTRAHSEERPEPCIIYYRVWPIENVGAIFGPFFAAAHRRAG